MKPENVNKIMSKIIKVWIEKYSIDNLDKRKIEAVRKVMLLSPHEDGFMRVQLTGEEDVYLIPFEDIILNGLKGSEVKKYGTETKTNSRKERKEN